MTRISLMVPDHCTIDEYESLLEEARMNAENDWEEEFVARLTQQYKQYGARTYVSEAQYTTLQRIAGELDE